jgi:hypothetical protein
MKLRREICVAGNTIDFLYKVPSARRKGETRAPKINPTPQDVQKVNDRYAAIELTRILNHNFVPGDWHLVNTYAGDEPTPEQAKKDLDEFKRKLNTEFKGLGRTLKWVAVTEYTHERIHHHIVCSYIDFQIIIKIWPHGDIRPTPLKRNKNYKRLANYLIKETSKTFRLPESVNKRRYTCSRTIVKPEVRREFVSFREIEEDPKPFKGYYIDQDTVRRGVHEVTGHPFLEYTMVSLEENPRIKKWYKGKKIRAARQNYNYLLRGMVEEEQISFDIVKIQEL